MGRQGGHRPAGGADGHGHLLFGRQSAGPRLDSAGASGPWWGDHRETSPWSSEVCPSVVGRYVASTTGRGRWLSRAGPSTVRRGRIRSSQLGSHQLALPSRAIVAGTSTMRTRVASTRIAVASPSPSIFSDGTGLATNARKTAIMIRAPDVMTRPVPAIPRATDSVLSLVRTYSSRIREMRNTS